MKPKPVCETVMPWLKANLGPRCLAPLTSTDAKALRAAVQIVELYQYTAGDDVIQAFGIIVSRMQSHTQRLAFHAIAHVGNWEDRGKIWGRAGLPEIEVGRCIHEPRHTEAA